jgi:hypothetical protein
MPMLTQRRGCQRTTFYRKIAASPTFFLVSDVVPMKAVRDAVLEASLWDSSGTHVASFPNKNHRFTGILGADDGTRTHDLLHGKQKAAVGRPRAFVQIGDGRNAVTEPRRSVIGTVFVRLEAAVVLGSLRVMRPMPQGLGAGAGPGSGPSRGLIDFDALPPLQTVAQRKLPKIKAFESEVAAKMGAKFALFASPEKTKGPALRGLSSSGGRI